MAAELEEMDKEIYKRLAENDAIEEARLRGDNVININRNKDLSIDFKEKSVNKLKLFVKISKTIT